MEKNKANTVKKKKKNNAFPKNKKGKGGEGIHLYVLTDTNDKI